MDKSLYDLVLMARKREGEVLKEVMDLLSPIVNKYGRLLLGEDTKQDLRVHIIHVIDTMPLQQFQHHHNKILFSYLAKSLKYEYIRLSKKHNRQIDVEFAFDQTLHDSETSFGSELILLEMMEVLSKKEAFIVECIYVHCLSVTELAQYLGLSRQAVNQDKNKALVKIKNLYFGEKSTKKRKHLNPMQRPNYKN